MRELKEREVAIVLWGGGEGGANSNFKKARSSFIFVFPRKVRYGTL
jgi:hypothetical protein